MLQYISLKTTLSKIFKILKMEKSWCEKNPLYTVAPHSPMRRLMQFIDICLYYVSINV